MNTLKKPPVGLVLGTPENNRLYVAEVGGGYTLQVYAAMREQAALLASREGYTVFDIVEKPNA